MIDTVEKQEKLDSKCRRKQETCEDKRRRIAQHKLETLVNRQKECLKKDMLRKRSLLEKSITNEIQVSSQSYHV